MPTTLQNVRADRLVAILLLLQARGGMSAPALARELEVSTRTIYRDLEALSAAGVPIYADRGAQGGVRLLEGYSTNLTGLSPGEAEALFLMGTPGPLEELGLGAALDGAQRKLLAALPPVGRVHAERVRQRVHVDPVGWERAPRPLPWLPVIARTLFNDHRLDMRYVRADNKVVERKVDPLGLVLKAGQWYLAALAGRWDVTYCVSRVLEATEVEEPCRRPEPFDLAPYWAERLAEFEADRGRTVVRVRVAPSAVDELAMHLGEDARARTLETEPDADGWRQLELTFDSMVDARVQLLGLGPAVVVEDPAKLRKAMARVAADVVDLYAGA
jgi:predicted DNA-binding transcriptional regulator YafY